VIVAVVTAVLRIVHSLNPDPPMVLVVSRPGRDLWRRQGKRTRSHHSNFQNPGSHTDNTLTRAKRRLTISGFRLKVATGSET